MVSGSEVLPYFTRMPCLSLGVAEAGVKSPLYFIELITKTKRQMKKPIKKTKDGKTILGLQFIPQAGVYIGLIKGEKSNKSAMWSKDGVHIVRSTPNLNIAG